jgi:hypothetical protein
MAITIDGTAGTISGVVAGGLPSGSVTSATIADATIASGDIASGVVPAGGKVLQVKTYTQTSEYTFSTGAWRDVTNMTVSITPASTSSKILVTVTMNGSSTANNFYGHGRVLRGTTAIGLGNSSGNAQLQAGWCISNNDAYTKGLTMSWSYLDSPSTTSSSTYKVQVWPSGQSFVLNRIGENNSETGYGRYSSTITVMEIGG